MTVSEKDQFCIKNEEICTKTRGIVCLKCWIVAALQESKDECGEARTECVELQAEVGVDTVLSALYIHAGD